MGFMSEPVQPLISRVLPPDRCEFAAIVDYLPARTADRMDSLKFVKESPIDVVMTTTIEDDNVGFLPQMVTPSLHKTVQKMREYGLKGFCFRQFDISQHEASMAYMIESAWDRNITPDDAYQRYAHDIAGDRAAKHLTEAFHELESLAASANGLMGLAFMFPHLYSKHWKKGSTPNSQWMEYVKMLRPIEHLLRKAVADSTSKGRKYVERYLNFVVFARKFISTLHVIRSARESYDRAQNLKREKPNHLEYHKLINYTADLLSEAEISSERALQTWIKVIADPTDLGTLAGLNAYGHDWLRGKSSEVYWDAQRYGILMETSD